LEYAWDPYLRQPGDLGVLRGVAGGVAEEARTRGFASQALAGFAFIAQPMMRQWQVLSIRENTQECPLCNHKRSLKPMAPPGYKAAISQGFWNQNNGWLFHRHRLREIPRLINVRALQNGNVISE
jgi:hypothetical protein